ncbi:MAG: hypothetical protein FWE48_01720, partial [Coriobacteriia bacterium]|nr:hypothetical protein [Coriobacteriia bacterium]
MTVNNGNRIRFNAKYLQLKNKFSKLAPMRVKIALALVAVFLLGIPLLTVANPEVFQNLTQQVQEQLNPASDITIPEHTDAPAAYLADYLVDTIPFDGEEGVSLETTTLTLWFDRDMSEFAELANIPALVEQITIDSGATLEIEEATWLDRPSYPHSLFIIPLVLADVETEHTVSFAAASSEAESLEEGTEEEAEPIFSFSFTTEGALIAEDEEAEEAENLSPPYALEVIEASQEATAAYQEIVPLAATATAEINKVLHTPANEPTPNLNFTFLVQRHSFLTAAGAPGPLTNLPPIGEMDGDTGRVVLNINATNGSPTTSGTTTTLRRALNILEGITFATPGTYIWHVSELDGSSNSSGRFNVEYSDAVYELRVVVTGSGASATATVHFVAIVEDQAATVGAPMFSWGNNSSGQLGLGDTTNRNRPTRVGTADNWVQASSFAGGSIAINAEGHLYVWGGPRNAPNMGRGGLGGTAPITSPERLIIPGAASDVWVNVDGGGSGVAGAQPADGYMAAVNDAGEMWVWGLNAVGQLGLGNTTTQNTPQRVPGAQAWAQVNVVSMSSDLLANRRSFVLAITKDGHLYSWGNNSFSQLGRTPGGANPAANVPGRVNNPAGVPATFRWEMARPGGIGTAFAIGNDGQIYSWGTNADRGAGWGDGVGILGRPGANSTTPTLTQANAPDSPATHVSPPVTGWIDVVQQVNDPRATVALSDCGRLFSWGAGTSATVAGLGRPGGGAASATRTNRPVQIGTASNWVAIGGGNAHTVAMTSDGRLYSWGANASGQLGQGNFTAHPNSPQFVMQTFGLAGFSQTGSGTSSFALVRTDPMVFTNVYTVTHPDTVTTRADLTKVLRQLAGQTVSTFSFDFAIERWSVDGDLTRANELPQLGTSVVDGNGRVTIAMNAPDVMVETESGISTLTRSINILSGIEFDGPGVFVWRISEVSGSSGATPPSQVTYSDALYELTVTVTEGGGVLTAVATMEAIVADISGGVAGARAFPMYSWGNNNNG